MNVITNTVPQIFMRQIKKVFM